MQRQRRLALALLGGWLLLVGPWEGRSVTLDPAARGAVRAKVNLVQGSWPLYHAAYASRNAHPEPRAIMQRIGEEEALILRDTRAGLRAIFDRMRTRPSTYALWYAYEKPQLLWDWDIRIGAGDVYVHPVARSPLERHPVLRAIKQGLRAVNPALGPLALLAALAWLLAAWRGAPNAERTLAAAVVLYVTAVHVVLQAEPRYATAYRPFEIALLAGLAVGMIRAIGRRPLQPPHSSRQSDAVSH